MAPRPHPHHPIYRYTCPLQAEASYRPSLDDSREASVGAREDGEEGGPWVTVGVPSVSSVCPLFTSEEMFFSSARGVAEKLVFVLSQQRSGTLIEFPVRDGHCS